MIKLLEQLSQFNEGDEAIHSLQRMEPSVAALMPARTSLVVNRARRRSEGISRHRSGSNRRVDGVHKRRVRKLAW